jgi:hypothetical protein
VSAFFLPPLFFRLLSRTRAQEVSCFSTCPFASLRWSGSGCVYVLVSVPLPQTHTPTRTHTHTHKHTHSLTNAFHQGLFNALPCACSARTYVHAHGHVCVFTHTHSLTNKHMHAHKHYTRLDAYVARTVYRKTPGKAAQAFANFFFYFFNTFLPRYIARRRQSYTSFCLRSPHRLHTLQQLMRSTISSTRYVLCV